MTEFSYLISRNYLRIGLFHFSYDKLYTDAVFLRNKLHELLANVKHSANSRIDLRADIPKLSMIILEPYFTDTEVTIPVIERNSVNIYTFQLKDIKAKR